MEATNNKIPKRYSKEQETNNRRNLIKDKKKYVEIK